MKNSLRAVLFGALLIGTVYAQSPSPLPFSVTIGGESAVVKKDEAFAVIEKPVAADASITVGARGEMIIINVARLAADGTPDPAAQPAVILLQNTASGSLGKTMDGQKLASGPSLVSITADGQTATVRCTIK